MHNTFAAYANYSVLTSRQTPVRFSALAPPRGPLAPRATRVSLARALLSLVAFAALVAFAREARAEGPFDGKWSFSGVGEQYKVVQWVAACGPPPVGSGSGGGTVNIVSEGDELVIIGGRVFRTNQCWDQNPSLSRQSHSAAGGGRAWSTRCATPANDPRHATVTTTVVALNDNQIRISEVGRYEITVADGHCIADVNRGGSLTRVRTDPIADAAPATTTSAPPVVSTTPPAPTPAPTTPPPAIDCTSPGEPARLEVRPKEKLLRTGESFAFKASVLDASGCPTQTATTWLMEGAPAGVRVDAAGKVTIAAEAQEGSFNLVVTAAGKSTKVKLSVTSPSRYDELLANSGLNAAGEKDESAVAEIATGSIGGSNAKAEDGSAARRMLFIAIVAGISLLLGVLAVIGMRRSRRAAILEREAEERHEGRLRDHEERKREREAQHAAQLKAHLDSVKQAQDAAAAAATPHDGEMICPSCRREFPRGSAFCPEDANRLIPLAGHEAGPAGSICPACKRGFNPGVKVCPHDGEELIPYAMTKTLMMVASPVAATRGKICPTCGGRFDGSAGFCGKDGTALVLIN